MLLAVLRWGRRRWVLTPWPSKYPMVLRALAVGRGWLILRITCRGIVPLLVMMLWLLLLLWGRGRAGAAVGLGVEWGLAAKHVGHLEDGVDEVAVRELPRAEAGSCDLAVAVDAAVGALNDHRGGGNDVDEGRLVGVLLQAPGDDGDVVLGTLVVQGAGQGGAAAGSGDCKRCECFPGRG